MRTNLMIAVGATGALTGLGAIGLMVAQQRELPVDRVTSSVSEAQPDEKPPLKHDWLLYRGRHWRIAGPPGPSLASVDAQEGNRGVCPAGMIEVEGEFLLDPSKTAAYDGNSVEELQKKTCSQWINRDYPERCLQFDRDKWLAIAEELERKPMHFCIDRFEYPNKKGEYPIIYANFHEAKELCEEQGKRLCSENEWTMACEGNEGTPYPHGYYRDPDACVQDRRWKAFNETAMHPRESDAAMAEMDRLWQGVPSGSRETCKSPYGVYDMTGNVDEWTVSSRPGERPSILKGGYWGPVRTRCRPSTRSHDENHAFYQQGFRCCAELDADVKPVGDSRAGAAAVSPLPAPER